MTCFVSSAPGRVCLFGEHQDYLGLPVIAAAIGLRIGLTAVPRPGGLFHLTLPDVNNSVDIDAGQDQTYGEERDYLRAAVNVLRRQGAAWPQGYDITIRGQIPIKAGVSSSSAMVVMWLGFLAQASEPALAVTPAQLAQLAYDTEVAEFHEPGGMMDHFCAAIGGVLHIRTRAPFSAQVLPVALDGIVLGDSRQDKATLPVLKARRADVEEGVRLMRRHRPDFDLHATPAGDLEPYWSRLPEREGRRLRANIANRDITRAALEAIREGRLDDLGPLLSAHHAQLRDGLDLSTPKIDAMLDGALAAGARGGKINGSGGGGCMFAWAPGREEAVADAIRAAGGVPYILSVDAGAAVTKT